MSEIILKGRLNAFEPCHEKPVYNKGADQPVQSHSLISMFVVHYLDSVIPNKLAKSEISRL